MRGDVEFKEYPLNVFLNQALGWDLDLLESVTSVVSLFYSINNYASHPISKSRNILCNLFAVSGLSNIQLLLYSMCEDLHLCINEAWRSFRPIALVACVEPYKHSFEQFTSKPWFVQKHVFISQIDMIRCKKNNGPHWMNMMSKTWSSHNRCTEWPPSQPPVCNGLHSYVEYGSRHSRIAEWPLRLSPTAFYEPSVGEIRLDVPGPALRHRSPLKTCHLINFLTFACPVPNCIFHLINHSGSFFH